MIQPAKVISRAKKICFADNINHSWALSVRKKQFSSGEFSLVGALSQWNAAAPCLALQKS